MASVEYSVEALLRVAFEAGIKAAEEMESTRTDRISSKLRKLEINHDYTVWRDKLPPEIEKAVNYFK